MKPHLLFVASMAALTLAANAWSSDKAEGHASRSRGDGDRAARGLQAVANPAGPGDAAYGWRYFTDAHDGRAVVISPEGTYYLSRGQGLTKVAQTQRAS